MAEIDGLLRIMTERGSSDLHVKVGNSPAVRLNGRLVVLHDLPVLNAEQTYALAVGMMKEPQRAAFEGSNEADFAYSLPGVGRFRVNVFHQRGTVGMTLRRVATERASVEELGLPPVIRQLADETRGLILVTGTAGSGKTTTLASMIDHINSTREGHIVTIEDPIEVLHQDKKCIVSQREIGIDTESYEDALRHVACPTLVIGSRDRLDPEHPMRIAEHWAELIPGAKFLVEGDGESPLAWRGGTLSRVIADFLVAVPD